MKSKILITIVAESVGIEYPRDPEFQSLAKAIAEVDEDIDVQIPEPDEIDTSRRKVTWGEIIKIFIDIVNTPEGKAATTTATTLLIKKILDVAVKWSQDRFNRLNHKRPIFIWIYSPERKVEEYVRVSGPNEGPQDRKAELVRMARIKKEIDEQDQNKFARMLHKIFKRR